MGAVAEDEREDSPAPPESAVAPARQPRGPYKKRSKTISNRAISKHRLEMYKELNAQDAELLDADRPRTRGECQDGARPCPYAACKYHLYLDVNELTGAITFNYPDKEIDEIPHTCALDLADEGGLTLMQIGDSLQLSRERIRQVENKVLIRLKQKKVVLDVMESGGFEHSSPGRHLDDEAEGDGAGSALAPEPEDPHAEYAEGIYRIYERTSRERAQGLPLPPPPPFRSPEVPPEEPIECEDLRVGEELVFLPEPPTMPKPLSERPLTDREQSVVNAYLKLAKEVGGKPLASRVGELAKVHGKPGSISASVCTALTAAQRKGVKLPYIDEKPVRTDRQAAPARKSGRKPARRAREAAPPVPPPELVAAPPEPEPPAQTAMVLVTSPDAFKNVLLMKRDALERQMAAIEVLLSL